MGKGPFAVNDWMLLFEDQWYFWSGSDFLRNMRNHHCKVFDEKWTTYRVKIFRILWCSLQKIFEYLRQNRNKYELAGNLQEIRRIYRRSIELQQEKISFNRRVKWGHSMDDCMFFVDFYRNKSKKCIRIACMTVNIDLRKSCDKTFLGTSY